MTLVHFLSFEVGQEQIIQEHDALEILLEAIQRTRQKYFLLDGGSTPCGAHLYFYIVLLLSIKRIAPWTYVWQ